MVNKSDSAEIRWGRSDDRLYVGFSNELPYLVAEQINNDEPPPKIVHEDGYSTIEYGLENVHASKRTPLDFVANRVIEPLREYYRERNLGRIAFVSKLEDIRQDGPLFSERNQ